MPSHIFVRLGRYHDAVLANVAAYEADLGDAKGCQESLGPEHNTDMLIYAANLGGEVRASIPNVLGFHFWFIIWGLVRRIAARQGGCVQNWFLAGKGVSTPLLETAHVSPSEIVLKCQKDCYIYSFAYAGASNVLHGLIW